MSQPLIECKNCGNHFHGKYCNECGEKVYSQKDKSLSHIFGEVFHFISHFDGSFFKTLKTILVSPGKMSLDYSSGIRKKYFKPVSLFLVLVVAYLLFPQFRGLNMQFGTYLSEQYRYAWFAVPVATYKIKTQHISGLELGVLYDHTSPAIAKLCLLMLIPLSALAISVLFFKKRKYFFDHFILSVEILSFYIFSQYLFLPVLALIAEKFAPFLNYLFYDDSWLWISFYILFGIYVTAAFKGFYKQPLWLCFLKAVLFYFVFTFVIQYVYNTVLYLLIMLFI